MPKPKFKISCEAQNGLAVIRIDGRISEWYNSADLFRSQVDTLISNGIKNVNVYINSGGGDVFQANEIRNEIKRFPGETKACLGALCASAATAIASDCDIVVAAKNMSYMFHKPSTYFEGNSDQVKSDLKLLENIESEYAQLYATKTGLSVDKIKTMWAQDYWMNAEEALKLGFINEIEGEVDVTEEDVETISAYKGAPKITATVKSPQQPKPENKQISSDMKELLITMSGLPAASTEIQLTAWLEGIRAKAARVEAAETELTNLKRASVEDKAEAEAEAAVLAKKITASGKGFWKNLLITDFAGTKAELDKMPGLAPLSASVNKNTVPGQVEDRSAWTYVDYQTKNPVALQALATDDEPRFRMLFKANYGYELPS